VEFMDDLPGSRGNVVSSSMIRRIIWQRSPRIVSKERETFPYFDIVIDCSVPLAY
jgi:hypothetical protein